MQKQEILTVDDKQYLVVALPMVAELLSYGSMSASGRSFVYRKWNSVKKESMSTHINIKLKLDLLKKGQMISQRDSFHSKDVFSHFFGNDNIGRPAIKIGLSKPLKK